MNGVSVLNVIQMEMDSAKLAVGVSLTLGACATLVSNICKEQTEEAVINFGSQDDTVCFKNTAYNYPIYRYPLLLVVLYLLDSARVKI